MDNISAELREQIPEFKKGKQYIFRLTGLKINPSDEAGQRRLMIPTKKIPAQDIIYDPWANEGAGGEITISYGDLIINTSENAKETHILKLKPIYFSSKSDPGGEKILSGGNISQKRLFEYLWLCNYNKSNRGKDWHLQAKYRYEFVDNEKKSKNRMSIVKRQQTARELVINLDEDKLRILCEQLANQHGSGFMYNPNMKEETLKLSLINLAEKDPERLMVLDKKVQTQTRLAIKEAVKYGIIINDQVRKQVVWGLDKRPLCYVKGNVPWEDRLVNHFISEDGAEDMKIMVIQIKEDRERRKTPNTDVQGRTEEEILSDARGKYETLFGKAPHHMKKLVNILKEIEVREESLVET